MLTVAVVVNTSVGDLFFFTFFPFSVYVHSLFTYLELQGTINFQSMQLVNGCAPNYKSCEYFGTYVVVRNQIECEILFFCSFTPQIMVAGSLPIS